MIRRLLPLLLLAACTSTAPEPAPNLRPYAQPLDNYDALLHAIGNAQIVLLGESTHGTHEFYVERARITQRLIREKGFTAVALEAQWVDTERVDRYVRGDSDDRTAIDALGGFDDFPRWMWRNREFAEFIEWLRAHNDAGAEVGVYGLDVYGRDESRAAMQEQLRAVDPAFAKEIAKLSAQKKLEAIFARRQKTTDPRTRELLFAAEQNARVVRNSEAYDRAERRGDVSSWNVRDWHMLQTLVALQRNGRDRIVVWAHNSHIGDARATWRAKAGEWNLGQLTREHWPRDASFLVGFSTHRGTVFAASSWGGKPRVEQLGESRPGSEGAMLHEVGLPRFLLLLRQIEDRGLGVPRLQRAVGVVYLPYRERTAHYFPATLREQFDALIHIDETTALEPIPPTLPGNDRGASGIPRA